ncbi:MAG: hypothetical protein K6B64_00210, partial [Acholeplasmatales bacterium]|nr:hypothetical protein [Acholeplasmatales bacterium]
MNDDIKKRIKEKRHILKKSIKVLVASSFIIPLLEIIIFATIILTYKALLDNNLFLGDKKNSLGFIIILMVPFVLIPDAIENFIVHKQVDLLSIVNIHFINAYEEKEIIDNRPHHHKDLIGDVRNFLNSFNNSVKMYKNIYMGLNECLDSYGVKTIKINNGIAYLPWVRLLIKYTSIILLFFIGIISIFSNYSNANAAFLLTYIIIHTSITEIISITFIMIYSS